MLESLHIFLLVARHQSFTKAAELLGLTRPAVSQQIKHLEQTFGVPLLTRSTRQVALTPGGEVLLAHAERVLTEYRHLEASMSALRQGERQALVIGASTLPGESLLPPVLAAFRRAHPQVEVQVRLGNTEAVLGLLKAGQVALGLVGQSVDDPMLAWEKVGDDEVVLALPPGLEAADPLPLDELLRVPLVLREAGSATRRVVLEALRQHGVEVSALQVAAEMGSPEAVKAAVRAGVGAAFVSRQALAGEGQPFVRLAGADLRRPIVACWRRDRGPEGSAGALLALLKEPVAQ
ncbi:MAG TPA: LysR family transcriptional regulator [Symbiobacteriaceae bacterium]|nr:LysR family transcriptional regulator [Symbiobacteriaceae bacterium]